MFQESFLLQSRCSLLFMVSINMTPISVRLSLRFDMHKAMIASKITAPLSFYHRDTLVFSKGSSSGFILRFEDGRRNLHVIRNGSLYGHRLG